MVTMDVLREIAERNKNKTGFVLIGKIGGSR